MKQELGNMELVLQKLESSLDGGYARDSLKLSLAYRNLIKQCYRSIEFTHELFDDLLKQLDTLKKLYQKSNQGTNNCLIKGDYSSAKTFTNTALELQLVINDLDQYKLSKDTK